MENDFATNVERSCPQIRYFALLVDKLLYPQV